MAAKSPGEERLGIVLQALQVAAIIVGGFWFLIEYRLNQQKEEREESLKYAAKAYEII